MGVSVTLSVKSLKSVSERCPGNVKENIFILNFPNFRTPMAF